MRALPFLFADIIKSMLRSIRIIVLFFLFFGQSEFSFLADQIQVGKINQRLEAVAKVMYVSKQSILIPLKIAKMQPAFSLLEQIILFEYYTNLGKKSQM